MTDWCILINTTPKYMSLAEVQITCLRRYAPQLITVPIFLATELTMNHPIVKRILLLPNVQYVSLNSSDADFLESRIAAMEYLSFFKFILPLQEDFWTDRCPDLLRLNNALDILRSDDQIQSIRLMPCPGPSRNDINYSANSEFKIIGHQDTYRFTYQATLWRPEVYTAFLKTVKNRALPEYNKLDVEKRPPWSSYCVRKNVAENLEGQQIFMDLFMTPKSIHLSIDRPLAHPNAVFLAPWPYRPTAVVHGLLEPWAKEFAQREGFKTLDGWY